MTSPLETAGFDETQRSTTSEELIASNPYIARLVHCWRTNRDKSALNISEDGKIKSFTFGDVSDLSKSVGKYFLDLNPNLRRIGLLSESRPEWIIMVFGAMISGAEIIALDPQLTDTELQRLIERGEVSLLIASKKHAKRCSSIFPDRPSLVLEDLVEEQRKQAVRSDYYLFNFDMERPVLNVFGSGTTGASRMISITMNGLFYQAHATSFRLHLQPDDRALSILPVNHLFELCCGTLGPLYVGSTVTYANTLMPHEIVELLTRLKITRLVGVPLFFKALKRSIELQIKQLPRSKRMLITLLMTLAFFLPAKWRAKLLPFHAKLGGHLRNFCSGGAPLPAPIFKFFSRIGIPIIQGYGLSEASPVVSANSPDDNRIGSCGKPLDGTEVRILDPNSEGHGDILIRGPQVMHGYWKDPEATAAIIDKDGWLHTGDQGYLDASGHLYLTGRKRNIIVLGGGKKVFPEEVEADLCGLTAAASFCVTYLETADGDEIVLVAVPSPDLLTKHGKDLESLRSEIFEDMKLQLQKTASYKHPARVLVVTAMPMTSTGKVKLGELKTMLQQKLFL